MSDLSPNLEDYLETIFLLENEQQAARAKDIADRMNVQRASVTGALHSLSEKGLINYQPYSSVTLTAEGFKKASNILYRHKVLFEFLHDFLQLPEDVSDENACRIEHQIDDLVLARLIDFVQFIKKSALAGQDWRQHFSPSKQNSQK